MTARRPPARPATRAPGRATRAPGRPAGRRTVAVRAVLALVALVLALASCSQLPTSGAVQVGDSQVNQPGTVYLGTPDSPRQGATPTQIVRGFLDAQAQGVTDNFRVAREYLAPEAAAWDPWASVTVFAGEPALRDVPDAAGPTPAPTAPDAPATPAPGATATVSGSLVSLATLSEDGAFAQESVGATSTLRFGLVADAQGQWRIRALDDGIVASRANFTAVYRAVSVYYPTTDRQMLVPDVRWFPQRVGPTEAVKAVLAGPVSWLRDATTSVVPAGTELSVESVQVDEDGVATVDLTSAVLAADAVERAILEQQLTEVLAQFPSIRSVRILAAGAPVTVGTTADLTVDPVPSSEPYVVVGDRVTHLQAAKPQAVPGTVRVPTDLTALGVGVEAGDGTPSIVVGRRGTGSIVRLDGRSVTTLLGGRGLVAPSVDRFGWVWTASSAGGAWVVDGDGKRLSVTAPWLSDREVLALRVSRDGARVALLTQGTSDVQIDLAGVVRNEAGAPVRLSDPISVGATVSGASALTWVDESTLGVVGRMPSGGADTVVLVPVGGFAQPVASPGSIDALTAGRGERTLYLGTRDGAVWQRNTTGAGWSTVLERGSFVTFPG